MPRVTTDVSPSVGAAVDPATHQVMVWTSAPGQLAHLIPLPPDLARYWASQMLSAADAAEAFASDHDSGG
ncbi:hypothetical protein HNR23_005020 [Nocardiopsis mwathae]|uniref:Uncharacterized protein n=1 Tax=Nocardiopsis mwathae TaxID=1472723 RepID=A0A7W9YMZ1_9ACTN|nr:hypothetical protein [Nocardiopsis mwathae]MBB6174960.1 hypothetical protein [Nocardiopsis mwathae]